MNTPHVLACGLAALSLLTSPAIAGLTDGMTEGTVTLQSAGPLAFGPEGILFVADTKAAAVASPPATPKPATPSR